MSSAKVFIFAPADETGATHRQMEEAGCEVLLGDASWHTPMGNNEGEMCALAKDADALTGTSIRSSPITRTIMEASDNLRIIAKHTVGVDDVEVEAATELGILVTHAPTESNFGGVAEGAISMMLALLKKTRERDEAMKAGKWREPELQGTYLGRRQDGYAGITLGLIGLGRIASRVALMLAPWRIRIIACDPYVAKDRFILTDTEQVDLPTLLKESDVVSLHVVLTPETHGMIGKAELDMMKPSAVLINTSRGWCVQEAALAEALQGDVIAGAAIDVYEHEPIASDSPLMGLGHKILMSAHMVSSNVGSGLKPGTEWATRSILAALNGDLPDNVYNTEVIPKWKERFGGRPVQGWPSNR